MDIYSFLFNLWMTLNGTTYNIYLIKCLVFIPGIEDKKERKLINMSLFTKNILFILSQFC